MSGKLICKARTTLVDDIWEKKGLQPLSWLLFAVVFPGVVPKYLRCFLKRGGTTFLQLLVQEQILCALFFLHPEVQCTQRHLKQATENSVGKPHFSKA